MGGLPRQRETEREVESFIMTWLIRPQPFSDELMSSWLVRIAWHNVMKLEGMTSRLWGSRSQIWTRDIDRISDPKIYKLVAELSNTNYERAYETTLASYQGHLFEHLCVKGPPPWIMPLGGRMRKRFQYGLQCCPICLSEDEEPYYRRRWRLAFITTCLKHSAILIDRCDCCGSSISFHQSDFGKRIDPFELRMTFCSRCGRDYRDIRPTPILSCPLGEFVLSFQKIVESALNSGWVELTNNLTIFSLLFFEGLRHLTRVIISTGYCSKFKKEIVRALRIRYSPTIFEHGRYCERIALESRFEYCGLLGWLLIDWPNNFIRCAKTARLSSSYFDLYRGTMPYWITMPIRWHLNRTWYHPNRDEISAVIDYLNKNGITISVNEISKQLGRSYTSRHKKVHLESLDNI